MTKGSRAASGSPDVRTGQPRVSRSWSLVREETAEGYTPAAQLLPLEKADSGVERTARWTEDATTETWRVGKNVVEERLKDLLLRGLEGEADAYRAFLRELSAHLRTFLRKRLSVLPDEVEDLVQECLIAIHSRRQTFDAGQPLTAWVHAIAKYKLVDLLRRRARHEKVTDPLDEDMDFLSADGSEAAEAKRDLDKLLDRLPERQRLPIVYTKLKGLSVIETAQITGMSESAIKVGVHRGLKALKASIRMSHEDR